MLDSLSEYSEDIHFQTKVECYIKRPTQIDSHPEFYRWWRSATQDEISKRKQHGPLANVLSNARVLMISKDTWMPTVPLNQPRHSLLIYWVSTSDSEWFWSVTFEKVLKSISCSPCSTWSCRSVLYWIMIWWTEDCNDFPLESIVTANAIFESVDFYYPDLEH